MSVGLGAPCQRGAIAAKQATYTRCTYSPFIVSSRRPRLATLARASAGEQWPAPSAYKLWPTEISISSGIYNFVQGAELVAYAALIDAGFSGDWSRIGVLTTDQELVAQQAWWFILAAHSVVAALSLGYALRQGFPPLEAGVRGLLFGSLGLYDVYVRCQLKQQAQRN